MKNYDKLSRKERGSKRWVVAYKVPSDPGRWLMHVCTATSEEAAWEETKKKLKLPNGSELVYAKPTT